MKKLITVVMFILLLIVFGVALILIPTHLQIRSVNTELPDFNEFASLKRGDGPVQIHYINTAEQRLPHSHLTHSSFVLEWSDGQIFLIDAGMPEAAARDFGELMEFVMDGEKSIVHGTIAALLGKNISRVAGMGFTHLHQDHAQGVTTLCDSGQLEAGLLQTDYQRDEHNFNTSASAEILRDSCLKPLSLAGGSLYQSTGFPGLGLVHLGGHTPGSTMFVAWLQDKLYVFSGDITNSKRDLLQDRGKGWLYSNMLVPEDTARTAQLRQWLRDLAQQPDTVIVVSHDLEDIRRSGLPQFVP